jgi:hypothetical protein
MNACSPRNPNICADCEALTLDDSPALLPAQIEADLVSQESAAPVEEMACRTSYSSGDLADRQRCPKSCNARVDFL